MQTIAVNPDERTERPGKGLHALLLVLAGLGAVGGCWVLRAFGI